MSCGVGKTTLATGLAHELHKRGHAVELVSEQVYFERDDLRFLADAYLTKHLPTAADPLEGLSRLAVQWPAFDVVVMDGSWMPAGEDLPWAQESWDAVVS